MQLSTHSVVRSMSTISVPPMYVRYVFRVYIFSFYCALFSSFSLSHSLSLSIFSTISSFWCLCCGLSLCVFFSVLLLLPLARAEDSRLMHILCLCYSMIVCCVRCLGFISFPNTPFRHTISFVISISPTRAQEIPNVIIANEKIFKYRFADAIHWNDGMARDFFSC